MKRKLLIWLYFFIKTAIKKEADFQEVKIKIIEQALEKYDANIEKYYNALLQKQMVNTIKTSEKIEKIKSESLELKKLL